jgi:hypothetical protein
MQLRKSRRKSQLEEHIFFLEEKFFEKISFFFPQKEEEQL